MRCDSHPAHPGSYDVNDNPTFRDDGEDLADSYERMRSMARRRLATSGIDSLDPTELAHEAWLRMQRRGETDAPRGRLMMMAARVMRDVLIEDARRRGALKRGGDWHRVSWETAATVATDHPAELLELDVAIERLSEEDAEVAEVVRLKFFAGLTGEEAAEALGLSPATVDRRWAFARTRLYELLNEE